MAIDLMIKILTNQIEQTIHLTFYDGFNPDMDISNESFI